ncbi:hypothetical protein BIZ83_gp220 [Erwinia phage vB_EamM_ChrisDB]|uniref:hypothetical protein n=1 Tax=Erwinia phage vB_EamM_ChrisDB TaxID=1883371 RepID=UPI00081C5C97|nr:hypothetical protein BIZ83_gp220 [Erwinia phage vB_EamM_ChrisDB]ANZ48633.1 hypothetical protein CHRISDB_71 [Erwinia phage vB_EamM_ChrisDB]
MRYSLIDLASVVRQTMPQSFDLIFKSSLRGMTHTVPDAIMVAIATIITQAYRTSTEHVLTYGGRHEFVCPALNYDQYLELKAAWQWLTKEDYTIFNKVHSADFSKQEYFWRKKQDRSSALFDGREVYMIVPARSEKVVRGEIYILETRNCDNLLDGKEAVRLHLPHSDLDITLKTQQLKEA